MAKFSPFGRRSPAVAARKIDLVVTNTGHYVELEAGGRISRIATMRIAGPNGPVDRFGGTAIARADNAAVRIYAELRGKLLARLLLGQRLAFEQPVAHRGQRRRRGVEVAGIGVRKRFHSFGRAQRQQCIKKRNSM